MTGEAASATVRYMANYSDERVVLSIAKALADMNRLRALWALHKQELCLCQLVELLGLAPSTVSKHMSVLLQARLVDSRKEGRWVFYRLGDDDAPSEAREAIAWVERALSNTRRIQGDKRRLKAILKIGRGELCRRQAER